MNITVYLGSVSGNDPKYDRAAAELGAWIADNGHTLVYGGAKKGMMGALSSAALAHGGKVIGVIPAVASIRARIKEDLTELVETDSMAERRTEMIRLGDAFIAMPGGPVTLEEITEVISCFRLGLVDAPCILYDLDGYYDYLKAHFEKMRREGFLEQDLDRVCFLQTAEEVFAKLQERADELTDNGAAPLNSSL